VGVRNSARPKAIVLDILATLIEAYDDKHYRMDPPDPIEAIKYRMEQQGLTRKRPRADDRHLARAWQRC
jgi:HTH-type transcriptional regulator/antitoxin HigA